MTAALLAGLLAGYSVALPVGAVGTYLVGLAARMSLQVGAAAALGVASADGLYAALAVTSGGWLAAALRPASGLLRAGGALVLLAAAARGAVRAWRRARAGGGAHGRGRRAAAAPGGLT